MSLDLPNDPNDVWGIHEGPYKPTKSLEDYVMLGKVHELKENDPALYNKLINKQ